MKEREKKNGYWSGKVIKRRAQEERKKKKKK